MDQRLRLLDQLGTMTWIEWTEWLIKNIGGASSHAENSAAQRDKALKSKSAEILLLHHAAMFLTGLNEFARDAGFPLEPYNHKSEKFGYEISAMAAAVKVWEDVDKHFEYSLHWLFDEPSCETSTPFKD